MRRARASPASVSPGSPARRMRLALDIVPMPPMPFLGSGPLDSDCF